KLPQKKKPQKKLPQKKLPQKKLPQKKLPQKKKPQKKLPQKKLPQKKLPQKKLPQKKLPPRSNSDAPSALSRVAESIAGQLDEGDFIGALHGLLTVWRDHRATELADLIDGVGRLIDSSLESITGDDPDAEERWFNVASQKRSEDVGRLLAALPKAFARMRQRVAMLELFPADPRITHAMVAMLPKYSRTFSVRPTFTHMFTTLKNMNDGRAGTQLRHRRETIDCEYLGPRIDKVLAAISAPPNIDDHERFTCARLEEKISELAKTPALTADELRALYKPTSKPADEEALLQAIFEDPADDAARLIYGDWLLERADPRGEFIALQYKNIGKPGKRLGGKDAKRERDLLRENLSRWTTPIDVAIKPKSARFRRGFLSACEVEFKTAEQREQLVGHPMWATVEEIVADDDLVTHPVMKALRKTTTSGAALSQISQREGAPPLERVWGSRFCDNGQWVREGAALHRDIREDGQLINREYDDVSWRDALNIGALTQLRTFSVALPPTWPRITAPDGSPFSRANAEDLRWFWDTPLGRQLEWIDLWGYHRDAYDLWSWLTPFEALPNLKRLTYRLTNANSCGAPCPMATIIIAPQDARFDVRVQLSKDELRYFSLLKQVRGALANPPRQDVPRITLEYTGRERKPELSSFHKMAERLAADFDEVNIVEHAEALSLT
ncbi:MAG: TIGR02996 domain-containing protein, partial [Deltaproteobacteria bacterium]|nr:TIGR02996 domain-containing protein [Deltaproteobacteria bacterium]